MSPPPHDRPKPAPSATRDDARAGPTGARFPFNRTAETVLLILLVGVFLWRGLVPGWRSLNSDFPNYYLAARLYRQGYPLERVYDLIWFQRQKDHAGLDRPIVSFIPLTPFSLLPLAPLASLPALQAKHVWLLTNLILLLATVYLLDRMTELGTRRVGILTLLAVFPLRNNLLLGQEHLLVLFLTTLAAWLYLEQKPASCGASLALGAAFKAYPALFLLYFLYKRQWRALAGLLVGLLALGSLSIWLFGFETCRVYALQVLPWTLRGEALDAYDVGQSSFTGLLHRLWIAEPALNPHPLAHLPVVYAFLQPLCQALFLLSLLWLTKPSRADQGREKLEWGCYVALLLILSTNTGLHHYCALILTVALVANHVLKRREVARAEALVILYALACFPLERFTPQFPSRWLTLAAYPRLYVFTAFWILLVATLAKASGDGPTWRTRPGKTAGFVALFAALVAFGAWANLRHQRGLFVSYASRIADMPHSLMVETPTTRGDALAFTFMSPRLAGYSVGDLAGHVLTPVEPGTDTFHPALAPGSSEEWVELASKRSRILRLPLGSASVTAAELPVEVEDGEQPTVSPDGRWLAFIRETEGRGSLWLKDLRSSATDRADAPAAKTERKVVDFTWDVLDAAFFPDNRIAFAAQPDGRPGLFVADLETRRVTPLEPGQVRARYPAVSPDGQWLAYAREQAGDWQLHVRRLPAGDERRLTGADCNSISPAWLADSRTLVYATDCGRGLGLAALCQIRVIP